MFNSPPRAKSTNMSPLRFKTKNLKDAYDMIWSAQQDNIYFQEFVNKINVLEPDHRQNNVNPNNIVFFDKYEQIVYKIAPWKLNGMGILNEYIAYKIFEKYNNSVLHVPTMYGCEIIPDTKYALLVISYNPSISSNHLATRNTVFKNNKNNGPNKITYLTKAENYLRNKGITHNDLLGNLYIINNDFFIIDFEQASFSNNSLRNLNTETHKKINDISSIMEKKNSNRYGKYTGKKLTF